MNHENWLNLAEIYALGALDGDDLKSFEGHLEAGCALCRSHMEKTSELLTYLPSSLSSVMPPSSIKAGVMAGIGAEAQPIASGQKGWQFLPWVGGLAAAGIATAVLFVFLNRPLPGTPVVQGPPVVQHSPELIQVLSSPEVQLIEFKGLDADPGAQGQLVWNPRVCRGCFTVKGMKLPEGKVFQLWAIAGDGAPVSVGVFTVDKDGNAHVDFPALGKTDFFDKFAVTAEPPGGALQPTGPMHILGAF
jgi:anti-sigma-K factor RskA